jgi:hypothetical protein
MKLIYCFKVIDLYITHTESWIQIETPALPLLIIFRYNKY